jgi:glutaredoxin 3
MSVTIYTTPTCGYCHQAKQYLSDRGVSYIEHDVSEDKAAADEMVRKTGQMGVPVIVVDDEVVVGFDRRRLESLLAGYAPKEKPRFGLRIADAATAAPKSGAQPVSGAFIGGVAAASPGDKAGLREGDIIIEVNLTQIRNADDLQHALSSITPGTRVSITFLREQQKKQTVIVVWQGSSLNSQI